MNEPQANTDKEIWREREGDYYSDSSIHITEKGHVGINCGGTVYVKSIREWHLLAANEGEKDDGTGMTEDEKANIG